MISKIDRRDIAPLSQQDLNPVLIAHERFVASQGGKRAQLSRRGLDGLNLANRTLAEADFSGSSLVGATLLGSSLQCASFYCADLRECNLRAVNLTRADMRGASFRGADLSHAVLDQGDLRPASIMIMDERGASVMDRRAFGGGADALDIPNGVDFTNCSLRNVSFGNARLDHANFSGAIMEGVKMKGASLSNAIFKGAVLSGVDLRDLQVPPEAFVGCVLDVTPEAEARGEKLKSMMIMHEMWIMNEGAAGNPVVLDGEDLRPLQDFCVGRRLTGLCARETVAININFSGCGLQAAKFDNADLRGADFTDCDLRGASFLNANLSHAVFTNTRLGPLKLANGGQLKQIMLGAVTSSLQFVTALIDGPIPELGFE